MNLLGGASKDRLLALDRVRFRLTTVWLLGSLPILVIVVVQSLFGRAYGNHANDAWGWLLPTLMPTLGMIVGTHAYTARDPLASQAQVRRDFFAVALFLSIVYLFFVYLTILVQPFVTKSAENRIALMQTSNLYLGPLQGLVATALGVLFASKQREQE